MINGIPGPNTTPSTHFFTVQNLSKAEGIHTILLTCECLEIDIVRIIFNVNTHHSLVVKGTILGEANKFKVINTVCFHDKLSKHANFLDPINYKVYLKGSF